MPPENFDLDPEASNLQVGIELEYPGLGDNDEKFIHRGRDTTGIQSEMRSVPFEGNPVYDGTVGLEIVSPRLDLDQASGWYEDAVEYVRNEWDTDFQPVGLMEGGSTAGLHIHVSPLDEEQARTLYDLSFEPWMQVLFCSSIAAGSDSITWPVFRGGGHCRMNMFNGSRYACVNRRGSGHYEWRLPEPMDPEHIPILEKFLRLFEGDPEWAIEYAQERLDEADDRLTSVKRAEAVGVAMEDMPVLERSMADSDPEAFYETVRDSWGAPNIYHVRYADDSFYAFESRLSGEFNVDNIVFTDDDVLRADTLEPVTDEEIREQIEVAITRDGRSDLRETEATEELKKIVKKKKK